MLSCAVLQGPENASAHSNLAYLNVLDGQLREARALYEQALLLDPELATAHHGLAEILPRLGDESGAAHHRALGLRYRPIAIDRYLGDGPPIRVLALGSAALGNVPSEGYFDNRVFLLASLTVEYADFTIPLPPHDVVFNVIGEADLCAVALVRAAEITARTNAPIINHPNEVAATNRAANALRLNRLDGVVTPLTILLARELLAGPATQSLLSEFGLVYPLLVRSPGYHTGDHFVMVDRADALSDAVASLPGDELLVIEYLDVRDAQENFRKIPCDDRRWSAVSAPSCHFSRVEGALL